MVVSYFYFQEWSKRYFIGEILFHNFNNYWRLENATAPSASETIPDTTETPVLNDNSFEKNNDGLVESKWNTAQYFSNKYWIYYAEGRCVCAVFNAEATTLNAEEPLFAHPTVEVQCDNAGQEYCNNVCIAAASRARGIGTAILCSMLGHVDQLKVKNGSCYIEMFWVNCFFFM